MKRLRVARIDELADFNEPAKIQSSLGTLFLKFVSVGPHFRILYVWNLGLIISCTYKVALFTRIFVFILKKEICQQECLPVEGQPTAYQ